MPEPMPLPDIPYGAPPFELDAKKPFSVLTFSFHVQMISSSNNQTNVTLLTFFYYKGLPVFCPGTHLHDEP